MAEEVLTSSQASVTFSSLGDYATAGYQHLQIRVVSRGDRSSNNSDGFALQFNSDTGSNYARHALYGSGSSTASWGFTGQTFINAGVTTGSTTDANAFDANVIDILDPFETSKYTTVRAMGGRAAASYFITLMSGVWLNTNAITDITMKPQIGSNFQQYSRFTLIGLK